MDVVDDATMVDASKKEEGIIILPIRRLLKCSTTSSLRTNQRLCRIPALDVLHILRDKI